MIYWRASWAEIRRALKESLSYPFSILSDVLIFSFLIIILLFFKTGTSLQEHYGNYKSSESLLLIGYLFWTFSIQAINSTSVDIRHEAVAGTLENKLMAVVPIEILLFGKMVSGLIRSIVIISIVSLFVYLFTKVEIVVTANTFLILLFNLLGMYGLGLLFGALVLKEKKIGQLTLLVQLFLLFTTDVLTKTPLSLNLGRFIPLTSGIDLARKSIAQVPIELKEFLIFALISLLWLMLGSFVFSFMERKTRREGSLNFY